MAKRKKDFEEKLKKDIDLMDAKDREKKKSAKQKGKWKRILTKKEPKLDKAQEEKKKQEILQETPAWNTGFLLSDE